MTEPKRDIRRERIDAFNHATGVGEKLTALFEDIDARFAVGDDYRVELGIWVWPCDPVLPPITYWTKLIKIDIHDAANPAILIDLSDRATDTLEEAVDLLVQEWRKLPRNDRTKTHPHEQ